MISSATSTQGAKADRTVTPADVIPELRVGLMVKFEGKAYEVDKLFPAAGKVQLKIGYAKLTVPAGDIPGVRLPEVFSGIGREIASMRQTRAASIVAAVREAVKTQPFGPVRENITPFQEVHAAVGLVVPTPVAGYVDSLQDRGGGFQADYATMAAVDKELQKSKLMLLGFTRDEKAQLKVVVSDEEELARFMASDKGIAWKKAGRGQVKLEVGVMAAIPALGWGALLFLAGTLRDEWKVANQGYGLVDRIMR